MNDMNGRDPLAELIFIACDISYLGMWLDTKLTRWRSLLEQLPEGTITPFISWYTEQGGRFLGEAKGLACDLSERNASTYLCQL